MARILIVDDEQGMLNILRFFLEKELHEVKQASDVPSALILLEQYKPDVIISDIIMPGLSGMEFIETLKMNGNKAKVILITGEPTVETAMQAVRAGAFEYIPKPVSRNRLVKSVNDAVHVKNLEDENREYKERLESLVARRTEELSATNENLELLNARLQRILETTRRLATIKESQLFGKVLLEEFGEHMDSEGGSLYFLEDNRLQLIHSLDPGHAPEVLDLPLKPNSLFERACRLKVPQVINDFEDTGDIEPSRYMRYANSSAMVFPLMDERFEVFGILSVHAKGRPPFSMSDMEVGSILLSIGGKGFRAIRSHQQLKESEHRYRLLAENAADVIWSVDMDFRYTYISPSVEALTGFPPDELIGRMAHEYLAPESMEHVLGIFQEELLCDSRDLNHQRVFEALILRKDCEPIWTEISARFLRNEQGEAIGILGITRDIHERKKMQEALEAREHMFRSIFDLTPVSIAITDMEGRYVDVNRSMYEKANIPKENLIGLRTIDLYDYEDSSYPSQSMDQLIATGELVNERISVRRKPTGEKIEILYSSRLISVEGKPFILSVSNNISPLLQIKEEKERLLAAIEQTGESIVITDAEGNIQYANPAFERTSGYTKDEVLGENPRILRSGKHSKEFYKTLWDTIKSGKAWTGRIINKKKNGDFYTDDATISPVIGKEGTIKNFIAVKRDISKTLELERQFVQAQRMESIGRLAGGVAHDFNNLLTAIGGHVELGMMDLVPGDPMVAHFEEIRQASVRAGKLTRQLLAFSRRQIMETKVLDLNAIVRGIDTMLKRLIGENIRIHHTLDDGVIPIKADAGKLEQVLVNLCVNGRDAMPEGGDLTIETRQCTLSEPRTNKGGTLPAGDYALLRVNDSGIGMSQDVLDKLFEPFFTTKPEGKGTGLGLATSFGIVQQHNGGIEVRSTPGEGTLFEIYLPLEKSKELDPPVPTLDPELPRGDETVLVVEDEQSVRQVTVLFLQRCGYQVFEAEGEKQALELLETIEDSVDLLVSDVVLKDSNGPELVPKIRPYQPTMRVLFVSGYTDNAMISKGILQPGIRYLQKPFTAKELAIKVREILDETS